MRTRVRRWFALGIALLLGAPLAGCNETAAQPSPTGPPRRLSETGLFVDGSATQIQAGVLAFSPQYPLWSDGATKRRWIKLPQGSFIDASQPDAWEFPRGTRLWKEFSVGRRVETRLIERLQDGSWRFATYIWNDDGTDAVLAPEEGIRALELSADTDRRYAIPSEADCRACHEGAAVPVLGFSALQLSPDRDPLAPHAEPAPADHVNLRTLAERGVLRNLPKNLIENPPRIAASSQTERAALGYLHGNCAHCHNDSSAEGAGVPVVAKLEQKVASGGSASRVLSSLIGEVSRFRGPGSHDPAQLVSPGHSEASVLVKRMHSRDARVQMPPLGTQVPDEEALALIERWIDRELEH